jgi:hypothetical protein
MHKNHTDTSRNYKKEDKSMNKFNNAENKFKKNWKIKKYNNQQCRN